MEISKLYKLLIIFFLCLNESFAQVSSFSACPQSAVNCSPCSSDSWTVQICPVLFSNAINSVSNKLLLTNFGFNIPVTATITGVSLSTSTWSCMPEDFYDSNVQLVVNNTANGSNKALLTNFMPYPSYNNTTYGSASDLWGTTLSPLIINDVNFGVAYEVTHTINAFSCFQLNGPIISSYNNFPVMEVFYMISTGIIKSQKSDSETTKVYTFDGNIYVNNSSFEEIKDAKIQIYNALGEVIFEEQKTIAPNEIKNLMLSNPNDGFYFVTISSNKNELIFSKKVLIDSN